MMCIKQRQLAILLLGLALFGCDSKLQTEVTAAPVTVTVLTLEAKALRATEDHPGRVAAVRSAEIRAQISGIVQRRLFEQGTDIAAGTVLYQINPAPFQAEVDSAIATLQKAEAVKNRAFLEVNRLAPLVQKGVISRQLYDDAISLQHQAVADVALAKATLERRKLDLSFASVAAPIAGRIDQSLVSEGALVSPTDTTPLARVQQINQVYVDVRLPASVLESMYPQADKTRPELWVEILSSSGKPLGMQGRMLFSGIDVDTGTGDVLVRVLVDNPQYRLLPGLYVQARIPRADYHNALSVPEQAVSRIAGQATVWLLDAQNQVQQVPIEVGELIAGHYRVLSGLSTGQQLVVEGTDRLTPMAQVVARPWQSIDAGTKLTADAP